jgi:uncharacterized membrane protein YeaQ/YmgE (transglycosylase-associated protein family)
MNWLVFLIVGLLAGVIAKAVMPGTRSEPAGWLMTIILGIAGAFVGGFIANALGFSGVGNGFIWSVLLAAIGAMVIIGLLRLFTGGRRTV